MNSVKTTPTVPIAETVVLTSPSCTGHGYNVKVCGQDNELNEMNSTNTLYLTQQESQLAANGAQGYKLHKCHFVNGLASALPKKYIRAVHGKCYQ